MNFRDIVFIAVAENLSFSGAAEELLISQPAVTNHIKELESKYQVQLFDRKGNRIYLTKAGKLLYNHLKIIRQQYRNLETEIGEINSTQKGSLRIGASSTISQYVIPKALAAFHKRYPKIELYLFNGNSFEMEQKLLANEIDVALVENDSSKVNIRYIQFMDDELIALTGKNSVYARKKVLTLTDLQEIPLILREKGSGTLEVIQLKLKKHQLLLDKLNIITHLGSTESIKNFLIDFDGIALISEKAVEKELLRNELLKINLKGIRFDRKFRIALLHGNESSSSKLFMGFLFNYNF